MTLLLGIAGCVSSADSVLGVSQSLSANETDAATAIEATEASASSGTTADLPADTNAASAPGTLAADEIVAANVVPEPAPRDGAGNPLLMEGTVLAFADAEESPREDVSEAAPPAVDVTGTIRHAPVNASAAAAPKSLFEMLRRQQLKTTSDNHTHLASLNTTVPADGTAATSGKAGAADSTAGGSIAGGASQLPGVSKHGNLFGEDEGDHASDDNPFEVASVGAFGRVSPNGLHLQTGKVHAECLKPGLVKILKTAQKHFGKPVIVTSGYRDRKDNRRAGGARKSLHMQCMAADIQIEGISKWDLAAYLRTVPGHGGVGTYCRTRSVHIDIGEERSWHYPCRRTTKRKS